MFSTTDPTGLIAIPAEEVIDGLQKFAERWGWPVVKDADPASLLRKVLRQRAEVVVIQMPPPGEPGLTLLERLRDQPRRILLVAVAEQHREWLEQRVRMAGVNWYFTSDLDVVGLERAVAAFLPQQVGHHAGRPVVPAAERAEALGRESGSR